MKTLYPNLRLLFSGDTLLVVFSALLFLASLANATHWQVLRAFRFCGVITMFLSLAFTLLAGMELSKQTGRQKRTIIAVILFSAATLLCLSGGHLVWCAN